MNHFSSFFGFFASILAVGLPAWGAEKAVNLPPAASHKVSFEKEIKPLFEASCIKCHAKGKEKGTLTDYVVTGNFTTVADHIQGERGVVSK